MARAPDSVSSSPAERRTPVRRMIGRGVAVLCLLSLGGAVVLAWQAVGEARLTAPPATPILYDRNGAFLSEIGVHTIADDGRR